MTVPAAATLSKIETIRTLLDKSAHEFSRALPRHLDIDRFLRIGLTMIRNNPALMDCSGQSLLAALMQSAQLGLEPDGILGHAYLIPYRNNKTSTNEAQFQVGYKGLISLARRSGEVRSISAHVVYEHDVFEFEYGINEKLKHVPTLDERGKKIAVYAIAHFKSGGYAFDVLSKADVEKIRNKSASRNSGPWMDFEEPMWRKTAIRQLAKYLPLSVEFQRAAALDEYADLVGMDVAGRGQAHAEEAMKRFAPAAASTDGVEETQENK